MHLNCVFPVACCLILTLCGMSRSLRLVGNAHPTTSLFFARNIGFKAGSMSVLHKTLKRNPTGRWRWVTLREGFAYVPQPNLQR